MAETSCNFRTIASIVGGEFFPGNNPEAVIHHLVIDSRKPVSVQSDIFFALVTQRNDGHRYISELIEKGMRHFVVNTMPEDEWLQSGAGFIIVNDTLEALQKLAAWLRNTFNIPVIGITGSNGKTIVKEWLWQLIGNDIPVVRSPASYNSQIGVPLSVWQMSPIHELGIFEAGISKPGEMEKLERIIRPDIGVFTNLGPAHNENFTSLRQKANEKLRLFRHSHKLICCLDHKEIMGAFNELDWDKKPELIYWSRKEQANLQILSCSKQAGNTLLTALNNGEQIQAQVPFTDEASLENIITCWLIMLHLGYSNKVFAERAQYLHPVAMRLTLKEGTNNCSLIDDSYSSDLASLGIALDFLAQQNQHRKKVIILSDLLQSGLAEAELYSEIARLIGKKKIERFVGVGPALLRQKHFFEPSSVFYNDTEDLLRAIPALKFTNESILVKGARVFGFERIIQALQQKTHETVLEVNLDALVHNLNYYRSKLQPGVKIMAMVKAFSYGSGSFEIANILQYHRADYLAVAYTDEGVALRKAGIRLPIMVMNPEEQGYEGIFRFGLEPEIYNFRTLDLLEQAIKRFGLPEGNPLKIHLKLDTGMHRLGFGSHEIVELLARLKRSSFKVETAFSHLAASEDASHDDFTQQQISAFEKICGQIHLGLGYRFMRHILNSAGITRFPQAQFEMVRLGIGLYGISSMTNEQTLLRHVSTLKSIISQVKVIPAGATIGYNREHKALCEMKIAIVPVGYADGLRRSLGNGKFSLLVNGKPAPVIGNINMDMCILDITGMQAEEGDEVVIFSPSYPVTLMAQAMQTIPYEVLSSISARVKRVYYQE